MYGDKRNYFLEKAQAVVGNSHDAEDAVQGAFLDYLNGNGSAKPVDLILQSRCDSIVADRAKGPKYVARIPSTARRTVESHSSLAGSVLDDSDPGDPELDDFYVKALLEDSV